MEQVSDEELVAQYRAAASGSAEAHALLDNLFQRHHARVGLWCLRMTGDRESAADLAQEVFLKVFRNLDSYRGEAKFSTWLYSVTRNHCFNELKARPSRPEQAFEPVLEELADRAEGPHEQMERADSTAAIAELVRSTLTDLEARIVTLHYVEELPLDAVTRMLNLENLSGAKAYIVSARRKLARAVERWKAREARARP